MATPTSSLSTIDAALLHLERPHAPLNVGALLTLERPLEPPELERRLRGRLRGLRRLAQRPASGWIGLTGPYWEDAFDFRLDEHVFRWGLPAPGGPAELDAVVAQIIAQPLPPHRPLWQVHVIDGLHGGRGAVLFEAHACMVSGITGLRMLQALLDRAGDRDLDAPLPPPRPGPTAVARAADALRRARSTASAAWRARPAPTARGRLDALVESVQKARADEVPALPWNVPVGPRRQVCLLDVEAADVEVLLGRGGLPEVALAGLAGGLQSYLTGRGGALPALEAMALVPLTVTAAEPGPSRSRSSAMRVRLPLRAPDADARVGATRAILDRMSSEAAWRGVSGLLQVADWLPPALLAGLLRRLRTGRVANVLATTLSGPREARTLCGRSIEAIHPLLPIVDSVGLSFAVCAYAGRLHAALVGDAATLPDLSKLAGGVGQTFTEQARLARSSG